MAMTGAYVLAAMYGAMAYDPQMVNNRIEITSISTSQCV